MPSRTLTARNPAVTLPRWAWPLLALTLAVLYAVTFDVGAVSSRLTDSSMYLHELFHDGRHLLGVPCH